MIACHVNLQKAKWCDIGFNHTYISTKMRYPNKFLHRRSQFNVFCPHMLPQVFLPCAFVGVNDIEIMVRSKRNGRFLAELGEQQSPSYRHANSSFAIKTLT